MRRRDSHAFNYFYLSVILLCFLTQAPLFAQLPEKEKSILAPKEDSLLNGKKSKLKTKNFYDSVFQRFNRHKFTKLLYSLAFVAPQINTLPDTIQALASENPYKKYKGKIIRNIHVLSLDPFGPTVIDTARQASTGAARFLNVVHIQSAPFVIKKMMLIREGQALDPYVMADQERILKELSYIDDARVIVVPDVSEDSVDVVVVTKDVWSIGVVVPTITTKKVSIRLFDANFAGLGDRLALTFSFASKRAPFARFDGVSYTYTNIMGTFTDLTLNYYQDDLHQKNIGFWLDRPFVTNRTKLAGGISYQYNKLAYGPDEENPSYSKASSGYIWLGRSYLIAEYKIPTRFIASAAFQATTYLQRPNIRIDSNRSYYDVSSFLASVAFSRNNYYLIDYFLNFGKTENIPYGRLIQLTFGPQFTNFYTRLYSGFSYAQGNFIKKFGYLQGRLDLGIFFNHRTFEDGVFTARLNYMSYLYFTPDKRYKFRTYIFSTYRQGFLRRSNNNEYAYINQDMHINNYSSDTVFKGVNSISCYFSTVAFTPWYLYGFRFAFTGMFAGGFKSDGFSKLFQTRFYTGIGVGLLIKNDNLIFPTFLISAYFYPTPEVGVPWLQMNFSETPDLHIRDYNPSAPSVISLTQ
ncbi:MAG: hypothetical protein NTY96_09170 [Bacteroidetes bacterium]|nr:hypothetical protein [Bacteroidota bacterium]